MSDAPITEPVVETSVDVPTPAAPATDPAPEQAPEVRDPAKLLSAYEAEKNKRREQEKSLKEIREEFNAFRAKAEGKEAEFTAAQEAQRVRDEALAGANARILKAEGRAAAAGKLNDPADALRYLDLSEFEVGSDGEVDSAAVASAITSLIANKPYLAAQGGQRFQGPADGGARTDASKPSQLTRADLAGMSPEQIEAAREAGRFDNLLGGK
jgi:vacuolar-type H+-ATPase subunit I/STV1